MLSSKLSLQRQPSMQPDQGMRERARTAPAPDKARQHSPS